MPDVYGPTVQVDAPGRAVAEARGAQELVDLRVLAGFLQLVHVDALSVDADLYPVGVQLVGRIPGKKPVLLLLSSSS